MIGAMAAGDARGRQYALGRTSELGALPIDGALSFNGDILGANGKQKPYVPIVEGGVAAKGNGVSRMVLLAIGAAQ